MTKWSGGREWGSVRSNGIYLESVGLSRCWWELLGLSSVGLSRVQLWLLGLNEGQ